MASSSRNSRRMLSSEEAIAEMLRFVDQGSDDEESGDECLENLYGSEASDEEEESDEEHPVNEKDGADEEHNKCYKRKTLTVMRIVNDIDSALELTNYKPFEIPKDKKTITGVIKVDRNKQNDENIVFSNQQPNNPSGRRDNANLIRPPVGVRPQARHATSPLDALQLFLTLDILNIILTNTNNRILNFIRKLPENFNQNFKYPFVKVVDLIELKAFIGLMYYRGLYQLSNISVPKLFSAEYGPRYFSATMSKHRFKFILKFFTFDDETTRTARWNKDRFAAIRDIFEKFMHECLTCLAPGDYLSLDETLYPMRNQISFRQYNPNKPAKYGLLFKSINAARYSYTFVAAPYCGRPVEEGDYYIQGTEGIVKYLVQQIEKATSMKGRNISFDRLYTSIPLVRWLYERDVTSIGTLQHNRKGIPEIIKGVKDRSNLSTEVYWEENGKMSLSSYVVKTASGKKNVLLLSTHDQILGLTKDDGKEKLGLYKLYDFTKGGTDIVDQRMSFYTSKTKSRRWTFTSFSYILDTARVNSATIMALNKGTNPKKIDSFEYCHEIAKALIIPFVERRSLNGLNWMVKQKIELVLGHPIKPVEVRQDIGPSTSESPTRCHVCVSENTGQGHKSNKNKLKRIQSLCQKCRKNSCREHLFQVCSKCREAKN